MYSFAIKQVLNNSECLYFCLRIVRFFKCYYYYVIILKTYFHDLIMWYVLNVKI